MQTSTDTLLVQTKTRPAKRRKAAASAAADEAAENEEVSLCGDTPCYAQKTLSAGHNWS